MSQLPPHDPKAEMAILGGILIDNATLLVARAALTCQDFYSPDHQAIWTAMEELAAERTPVDLVTLGAALTRGGDLERVGGYEYLVKLLDATPSAANVEYYAEVVREAAGRRRIIAATTEAVRLAHDPTSTAEERAAAARAVRLAEAPTHNRDDDLSEAIERARAQARDEAGESWRWRTGIEVLDDMSAGLRAGGLLVIGGRSGMHKTAMACNLLWSAIQAEHRAAMFRYEESQEAILLRLASLACGQPYGDVCDKPTVGAALDEALAVHADLFKTRLRIHVGYTLARIELALEEWKPFLVVYDTLQAMTARVGIKHRDRRDLDTQDVLAMTAALAAEPGNEHIAVMISQLQKGRGKPTIEQLRESGAIEETADAALLLWWPYKEDEEQEPDRLVVQWAKNRWTGRKGSLVTEIDPGTQRIGKRINQFEAAEFLKRC